MGLFIGQENLSLYDNLDWERSRDIFKTHDFVYPDYYISQDFHGIRGGYLNPIAPVTYDAVTGFAAPPNEIKQRQKAIATIRGEPQSILDLGCGTGSSTLILKQAFAQAKVTGLDISPYMLLMAEYKSQKAGLVVDWQQGLAEGTSFRGEQFDLISISFLFHETPVPIAQEILQESMRLLKPGGQVIILDGNQQKLRHADWLVKLFREPYSRLYARECVDNWLKDLGFKEVETNYVGWISQITTGFK